MDMKERLTEAIEQADISYNAEFDSVMVTEWYNDLFDEELSPEQIAKYLVQMALPRKKLTKNQSRLWHIKTGNWVRVLYQKRQIGFDAYRESSDAEKARKIRAEKAEIRAERELDPEQQKRVRGEWYHEEPEYWRGQ